MPRIRPARMAASPAKYRGFPYGGGFFSIMRVREYAGHVRQVMDLFTDQVGPPLAERESRFAAKIGAFECLTDDVVYAHSTKVITPFQAGLFAGADMTSQPRDNLDLGRWFRSPESHERHVRGHRRAGVRIVRDGPTLISTLDAHVSHPGVFSRDDIFLYRLASPLVPPEESPAF